MLFKMCVKMPHKQGVPTFSTPSGTPAGGPSMSLEPRRERPYRGEYLQWAPGVNNSGESLLAWSSLRAVVALPLQLLQGASICALPLAISFLAFLHSPVLSFHLVKPFSCPCHVKDTRKFYPNDISNNPDQNQSGLLRDIPAGLRGRAAEPQN